MPNNLPNEEYWIKREAYKLKKGLKDLKKMASEKQIELVLKLIDDKMQIVGTQS